MMTQPSLGIIGAGKVGQTLARLLFQAGYTIAAIHSRTPAKTVALAQLTDSSVTDSPAAVLESADLTLLTVPDDAIATLVETLSHSKLQGKGVIHTSGAMDATVLSILAQQGASTGSLHPVYPFANVDSAIRGLPGATFAIEAGDDWLMACLGDMVTALNGTILKLQPGDKVLYHAALVIASNYTVVLYEVARRLLAEISDDDRAIHTALNTLLEGTLANLKQHEPAQALTGPLVRGDVGTIRAHLDALGQDRPQVATLYRELARQALPMLYHPPDSLTQLLNEEVSHETDHS